MKHRLLVLAMLLVNGMAQGKPSVGDMAPDSAGIGQDGKIVTVSASRGKVVVLTFWASWCTYCRKELPILEKIQRIAGNRQLQVIGIDLKERVLSTKKFIANSTSWQMMFTEDPDAALAKQYGLQGLPFLVMIDRDGRIAHLHFGYADKMLDQILKELNGLLQAKPATSASAS